MKSNVVDFVLIEYKLQREYQFYVSCFYCFVINSHIDSHCDWLQIEDYDKRTVLHVAAADGHADIVSYLMSLNMDLTVQDRYN